jgi:uncharacterized membrane protein YraQ (UPF0718 family)
MESPREPERIFLAVVVLVVGTLVYRSFLTLAAFRVWAVIVVSLILEALPFLVLGSAAAAFVHILVPAGRLPALARRLGPLGIPLAALSGIVAPVCECAIVPTVSSLRARGLPLAHTLTLLVAVPLLNPVVLLSTLAAFPGRPDLVAARFGGGFVVAVTVGALVSIRERRVAPAEPSAAAGSPLTIEPWSAPSLRPDIPAFAAHALAEFLTVAGYFTVGALLASLVQVAVPPDAFARLGGLPLVATLGMIALAWLLSVCSEADAFIGKAFLPLVPASAVIAFLVFGPMLDLKNTIMLRRLLTGRQILALALLLVTLVTLLAAGLQVLWG